MIEDAVFVPFGEDHLAATLTVPDDGDPTGLVLLMTGLGAHRGHRFGVWTRTARRLADAGVASIRFEYRGVGESTGVLGKDGVWAMADVPVDQAEAVARFGMRATGARRLAAAGNCGGAWTALVLAERMPETVGVVFIRAPILAPVEYGTLARRARRRSKFRRLIRSNPMLRRAARAAIAATARRGIDLEGGYRRALHHARILFLFGEEDMRRSDEARSGIARLPSLLPADLHDRYEVRVIPGASLQGFESIETQDQVVDVVAEWTANLFAAERTTAPA